MMLNTTSNNQDIQRLKALFNITWLLDKVLAGELTRHEALILKAWLETGKRVVHSDWLAKKTGVAPRRVGKLITSLINKGVWRETEDSPYKGVKNGAGYETRILTFGPLFDVELKNAALSCKNGNLDECSAKNGSLISLITTNNFFDQSQNEVCEFSKIVFSWSGSELTNEIRSKYESWKPKVCSLVSALEQHGYSQEYLLENVNLIAKELTWGSGKHDQTLLADKADLIRPIICSNFSNIEFPVIKPDEASEDESDLSYYEMVRARRRKNV